VKSYELSAQARIDYFEAFEFILSHYTMPTAIKWETRMLEAFDHLAEWPQSGRIRPEFAPPHLRFWIEGDYVILYDPSSDPLAIVAILHGAQDLLPLISARLEDHHPQDPQDPTETE